MNPQDRDICANSVKSVLGGSGLLDLRGIKLLEWPSSLLELPENTSFLLPISETQRFDQLAGRQYTMTVAFALAGTREPAQVRAYLQEQKQSRLAELAVGPMADAAAQAALVQEMAATKRHASDGQLIESQVRNVLSGDSCCLTLCELRKGYDFYKSYLADGASLPQALQHLTVLRVLYLGSAKQLKLPPLVLPSLEYLDMRSSGLLKIPSWMGQLAALKVLHLDANPQARLPTSPGPLRHLRVLELTNAGITEMPLWLEELPVLQDLYLSRNRLARLPEPRGLRSLRVLDLEKCGLSRLPHWVVQLPRLTQLSLHGNPLQMPPGSIATGGLEGLRRYMADARRFGLSQSSQAKLVLVGSGLAGKTSLLRGLCSGRPTMTAEADRTVQLDISTLSLTEGASLTCWDFGGQPEYAAAQQAYLKGDGVYVLVVPAHMAHDNQEDVNNNRYELVARWLNALQANAPGAEVQLILSQIDRVAATGTALDELLRGPMIEDALSSRLKRFEQPDIFRGHLRALQERLASEDQVLASRIAWLLARVAEHQEAQTSSKKKKLNISKKPDVLLVSSFSKQGTDGIKSDWVDARQGNAAGDDMRDAIYGAISDLSLSTCFEKLKDLSAKCPSMKFMIPNSYVPAMAFLRALRDGRNPLHAALVQNETTPISAQRRPYIERSALLEMWGSDIVPAFEARAYLVRNPEVPDALDFGTPYGLPGTPWSGVPVLVVKYTTYDSDLLTQHDLSATGFLPGIVKFLPGQIQLDSHVYVQLDGTHDLVQVRSEDAKIGLQLPELRSFQFTDALELVCQQGEMFAAGGLVFLDPEFITELIKPMVDHRLDDAEHASRIRDGLRAYIKVAPEFASDKRALERLEAKLRSFLKEGRLDIELINFLWRGIALDCAHHLHALAMLVETGMMVEEVEASMASSSSSNQSVARQASWIVPMKLPVERPITVSKRWPEQLGQAEEELQVTYSLYGYMPPDVPHRVVSACYALGNVAACWRRGALIIAANRAKVLMFVCEDHIIVCARGSAIPDVWQATASAMQQVEHILDDIPGVQVACSLACPKCLKKSPKAAFQFRGFSEEEALRLNSWCETCEVDLNLQLGPMAKRQRLTPAAAAGAALREALESAEHATAQQQQQLDLVAALSIQQQQQLSQVVNAGSVLATQATRTEQRVDGIECAGTALASQVVAQHVALQHVVQAGAVLTDQAVAQAGHTMQTAQRLHGAEARLDGIDHDVQAGARQGAAQEARLNTLESQALTLMKQQQDEYEKLRDAVRKLSLSGNELDELNKAVVALGVGFGVTLPSTTLPTLQKGTGFLVHADGFLITDHHVFLDMQAAKPPPGTPAGTPRRYYVGIGSPITWTWTAEMLDWSATPRAPVPGQPEHRDVTVSPWLDLCVMELKMTVSGSSYWPFIGPVPTLTLGDSDTVQTGEPIWVLGYGQQQPSKPTRHTCPGAYAGRDTDEWAALTPGGPKPTPSELLMVTADMLAGHSGGPGMVIRNGTPVVIGWNIMSLGEPVLNAETLRKIPPSAVSAGDIPVQGVPPPAVAGMPALPAPVHWFRPERASAYHFRGGLHGMRPINLAKPMLQSKTPWVP